MHESLKTLHLYLPPYHQSCYSLQYIFNSREYCTMLTNQNKPLIYPHYFLAAMQTFLFEAFHTL